MCENSYSLFKSCFGYGVIGWSKKGVCYIDLPFGEKKEMMGRFVEYFGAGEDILLNPDNSSSYWVFLAIEKILDHLSGKPQDFTDIPIDVGDISSFSRKVYTLTQRIKCGKTDTYGGLARKANSPQAARSIGTIMAKNKIPLIIPCHRVLPAKGGIGSYSGYGGNQTKRILLEIEGVKLD